MFHSEKHFIQRLHAYHTFTMRNENYLEATSHLTIWRQGITCMEMNQKVTWYEHKPIDDLSFVRQERYTI